MTTLAEKKLENKRITLAQKKVSNFAPPIEESNPYNPITNFAKSIVSAPATILARPFQLGAELLGASSDQVDKFSNKYSGGLVKPVPQNGGDVKKDVGRAAQTVALGMGPVTGGATFGFGNSLEQGNDIFSGQTVFQTVLGAGAGKVLDLIGKPVFNAAGKAISKITPQFLSDIASQGVKAVEEFAASHDILPKAVGKAVNETIKKTESIVNKPFSAVGNKVKGLINGKTEAEILATAEDKLYKLSAPERKVYFEAKQNEINTKSEKLKFEVKKDLEQSAVKSQKEAEELKRELAVASRDKVIELRPKIRSALGSQSQEYRRLVEEELAPHAEIKVSHDDLGFFVDTKFSEDPQKALAIKNKFSIEKGKNTTIGEIYEKSKSLGQEIGSASKKGTRVFTPTEKITDDAIHTLTDFMKTKGVDLSQARQFWAKYAPIRNQLVSEAKPFLQTDTQTKTFANTLSRVSRGADVNSENFIGAVEDLLGTSISKETKAIVEKMNQNERQALSDEILAKTKQVDLEIEKDKAIEKLTSKQIETERLARKRKAILLILKGVGTIAGYNTAKKYIPILP